MESREGWGSLASFMNSLENEGSVIRGGPLVSSWLQRVGHAQVRRRDTLRICCVRGIVFR